jgi:hypothetical protein
MNKLIRPHDCYRRNQMIWKQSRENPRSAPKMTKLPCEKIAVKIAYVSLRKISKEFNISVVKKTFGKGIVRISCKTVVQLEYITLVIKELIEFGLIEQIGMASEYSETMNKLLLFLKPVDELAMELHHVFQTCSFEFHYAVIDVKHPTVATKKSFKIKIIAVKNAYSSLRQILIEFNIPCVKKTFGPAIVRVSCRSVLQLDNITLILKPLLQVQLIKEIGMPLEHSYKLKTLILVIKAVNIEASMYLDELFEKSPFDYYFRVIDIQYPPEILQKVNSAMIKPEHEDANSKMSVSTIIIHLITIIMMVMLTYEIAASGPPEVLLLF